MPPVMSAPKKVPAPVIDMPVPYPKIVICGVEIDELNATITESIAKELLGYEEETKDVKFGKDYLLTLPNGNKVRCTHNTKNRPLDEKHAQKLAQDILNGHWKLNLETIIVGLHGQVLSGQHRLLALIIAVSEWRDGANSEHWRGKWEGEPTIKALVAFGCSEDKETTRTLDNVKTRTLADVLFADGEVFGNASTSDRKTLTAMVDYAIRCLWHRTGAKNDAYSPMRTHSESLDFLATHPRILKCVKHLYEEDGDGHAIKSLIPLGTASGLLYLMGCAETDIELYKDGGMVEEALKWGLWKKAQEFWTLLGKGEGGFKLVRKALSDLIDNEDGVKLKEREALVIKAWLTYSADNPMTDHQLGYDYITTKDGKKRIDRNSLIINDNPSCGGIDLGDPDEARRDEEAAVRAAKKEEQDKIKAAEKELKDAAKKAAPPESLSEILTRIRNDSDLFDAVLLFPSRSNNDGYNVYGGNAETCAKLLKGEAKLVDGFKHFVVPKDSMPALEKAKLRLAVCGKNADLKTVYLGDYTPGGFIPLQEESPKPVAPLATAQEREIAKRKDEVKAKSIESKVNGKPAPAAKPSKVPTKPALRGGK